MSDFKELFEGDMKRYGARPDGYVKRLIRYFRRAQTARGKLPQLLYRALYRAHSSKHGMEIPWDTKIGRGLYLGHVYNITVNHGAEIGENCNIHKGAVIGQTNRGELKGVPKIGDRVWIGVNAAVVGGITIGDDVLIAPNSFVNRDVPAHSVVFGNPCVIKPAEHATEGYINRMA